MGAFSPGSNINPTTIWTPQQGWLNGGSAPAPTAAPTANPFGVADPKTGNIFQDPTATAKPTATSFTGANGLTTTGVMNPFGLTQNMPQFGANMFGAPPSGGNVFGAGNNNPGFPGLQAPVSPLAPGQTDPTGDARRSQAYTDAGYTQNAQGGWEPPGGTDNPFHSYVAPTLLGDRSARNGNPLAFNPNQNVPPTTDANPDIGDFTKGTYMNGQWQSFAGGTTGGAPGAIPGVNGFSVNGQWLPFSAAGTAPPTPGVSPSNPTGVAPPAANNGPAPFSFLDNVTSSHLDASGNKVFNPTNPNQFATPQTAQQIAAMFGQKPWGLNLQGPGMGFSQDMQMFGPGVNAGLAAGELNRYGTTPGSYGNYLVNRDVTGNYGSSPWDNFTRSGGPGAPQGTNGSTSTAGVPVPLTSPTTTGGGSLTPTTPNIFLPPSSTGAGQPQGSSAPGGGNNGSTDALMQLLLGGTGGGSTASAPQQPGFSGSPDQWLADYTNNTGYLQNIAANNGNPTNTLPAWASMVDAMQRNVARGGADLQAKFAASGNRFGTDFGNAATDYYNQAGLNQNMLLGQMTLQAQEAAQGRSLSAAQQLAGQGFQGASQLSSQDFQSLMQASGGNIQAGLLGQQLFGQNSQAALNRQLQAAMGFMQSGYGASSTMAGLGAQGAQGLQAGALQGAQGLFNTENTAAQNEIQRQIMLQQMGLGALTSGTQLGQSNLSLGNQLGQGQFGTLTAVQQAAVQEWLRTQPQYNPLLQMMYSGATGYPAMYQPQYAPSQTPGILGGLGAILGAGGTSGIGASIGTALGSLIGLFSESILKENIVPIGIVNGLTLYFFNYKNDSKPQVGFMAEEVQQLYPQAITTQWGLRKIDYTKLGRMN